MARRAGLIFLGVIAMAASGLLPIVVASFLGAVAMVASGCLNLRQALRAVDERIYFLVGSALAMGTALEATSGAAFLGGLITSGFMGFGPAVTLSALFLAVAIMTNLLSNNATAVLFTPIAINVAQRFDTDPLPFALAVLFAANCSFASPIGYKTNLLVMGPGHYRFADFTRAGAPLVLILWAVFSVLAPWWYSL
jgi:di/tricarboxylate transporter